MTVPTYANPALHNGASRILWGASNYGYFEHKAGYQIWTAGEYFKQVNPEQDEQEAWSFSEQSRSIVTLSKYLEGYLIRNN